MKYLLLFIFSLVFWDVSAQNFHFLDIAVYKNGVRLQNPWVGGLNAPQWAVVDLNADGRKDLYAFDRLGNVHISFLNKSNMPGEVNYEYDRSLVAGFPLVSDFVLMRDFNLDGVADLFASAKDENLKGLKVFRGAWQNGRLVFDRVLFPDYTYNIIPYYAADTLVDQIRIWQQVDYPAVEDMDDDGDLDILAININSSKVFFYKNIAIEKGFTPDTLLYELADDCWGRFGLLPDTQTLVTSTNINMCAFFNDPVVWEDRDVVHGGSTLCIFDNDGDGDRELLYGDFMNAHIIFGKNNGDAQMAWITEQDTSFPQYDIPINIPVFPAVFFLDINNDGNRDLIASPNQMWTTPDRETAWYYENTTTDDMPVFNRIQKDFMGNTMLDFGTGAHPVFADVNADGLLDIVAGNREYWTPGGPVSALFLLLNIGTENDPAFELADDNWLGLGQYAPDLNAPAPAIGDLDNDGDMDLLIGDRWGYLHFLENTAGAGAPMEFGNIQFNWKNIDVGQMATPFIFDINKDGLPDLLVGELKGTINYFPNMGTAENPDFHPDADAPPNNSFFGEINTQPFNSTAGYSQPFVLEFGDTLYLITGSLRGGIKRYLIDPDSINGGAFDLVDEKWGGLREGAITRIAFADINADNILETLIGNDRGGLGLFQSPLTTDGLVAGRHRIANAAPPYKIFPNPAPGAFQIYTSEKAEVVIYNRLGRKILFFKNIYNNGEIDLSGEAPGIFFIFIKYKNRMYVERIAVF